jgi:tetratricopeptide (TPR) repeat protein
VDSSEKVLARLEAIESALQKQRERDFQSLQSSNRTLLIVAILFAGVSLLTMVCTSLLQARAINRLAEATSAAAGAPLLNGPALELGGATPRLIGPSSNARWLGAVERLEQRVRELEQGLEGASASPSRPGERAENGTRFEAADSHATLLGKGQVLLNLGREEEALKCFDAVLAAEPTHAEALMRKGTTLERLHRFDEAIDHFERAAASEPASTRAWLGKASVLNQQERFKEALECYEHALKIQSVTGAKSA